MHWRRGSWGSLRYLTRPCRRRPPSPFEWGHAEGVRKYLGPPSAILCFEPAPSSSAGTHICASLRLFEETYWIRSVLSSLRFRHEPLAPGTMAPRARTLRPQNSLRTVAPFDYLLNVVYQALTDALSECDNDPRTSRSATEHWKRLSAADGYLVLLDRAQLRAADAWIHTPPLGAQASRVLYVALVPATRLLRRRGPFDPAVGVATDRRLG